MTQEEFEKQIRIPVDDFCGDSLTKHKISQIIVNTLLLCVDNPEQAEDYYYKLKPYIKKLKN